MHKKPEFSKSLQLEGFLDSPDVCLENSFGINPFAPLFTNEFIKEQSLEEMEIPDRIVLGKRIEILALAVLNASSEFDIIGHNIQINEEKITKGEIDFLINDLINKAVLHVELVYKFYLLDENSTSTDLKNWIGPNRKDSLALKLNRLLTHQLPILKSEWCQPKLEELGLETNQIEQKVWFKTQLFVPYSSDIEWNPRINEKCKVGFWCRMVDFKNFATTEDSFYLPEKKSWMINPDYNSTWNTLEKIQVEIEIYMNNQRSPLCWMKDKNGSVSKFFIVWW